MSGFARVAAAGDVPSLAVLFDGYRRFYGQSSDVDAAAAFVSERLALGDSQLLVAELDDALAGFTQLYPTFTSVGLRRAWVLNDLFVAEHARGRGLARALVESARAHAAATGAARLSLATQKTNAPAKVLYESLGWVRDETFDYYSLTL